MTAMGDGATIVKMLISNVLASTYVTSPVVIKVYKCSIYPAGGGKKYAEYITKNPSHKWRSWIHKITGLIYLLFMELVMSRVELKLLRLFFLGYILSTG